NKKGKAKRIVNDNVFGDDAGGADQLTIVGLQYRSCIRGISDRINRSVVFIVEKYRQMLPDRLKEFEYPGVIHLRSDTFDMLCVAIRYAVGKLCRERYEIIRLRGGRTVAHRDHHN